MAKINPPPNNSEVIDESRMPTLPWAVFFNQLFTGDTGTSWTPVFTNLTTSGTVNFTGNYYKLSQNLVYFSITVTPSGGGSSTATAGTTYSNFPLNISRDGACLAVSGLLGGAVGMCEASTDRVYVPAWTSVTVPLTIVGIIEAR